MSWTKFLTSRVLINIFFVNQPFFNLPSRPPDSPVPPSSKMRKINYRKVRILDDSLERKTFVEGYQISWLLLALPRLPGEG